MTNGEKAGFSSYRFCTFASRKNTGVIKSQKTPEKSMTNEIGRQK